MTMMMTTVATTAFPIAITAPNGTRKIARSLADRIATVGWDHTHRAFYSRTYAATHARRNAIPTIPMKNLDSIVPKENFVAGVLKEKPKRNVGRGYKSVAKIVWKTSVVACLHDELMLISTLTATPENLRP
ncbi:hypothetical protein K8I61_19230 [bacterium]|nr:hypothetical protein [bacterium]